MIYRSSVVVVVVKVIFKKFVLVCHRPGNICISNPAVMLHVNLRVGVPHTSDTTSINTTLLLIIIISPVIVLARPV